MNPSAPPTADDPRVIEALDAYVAALEAGRKPGRAAFLAEHPDIAGPLADCLDGLDLVQHAAAQLDPPAADADLAGATPLGDFRLVRVIGRGGMGVVYEAEQLSLGRRVALKVLPFAAALDPKQLQRFKYEAQAAAHLQHPNIVPVYGVGCERGVHYYAMQLIDGRSLGEVIRELRGTDGEPDPAADTRPVAALSTEHGGATQESFRRAARLGLQAARALEYAHQVGVIHRDVKPANLLVDAADHLWVTDFGLAQFQGQAGLTMTGDVLGTLRYMSPEQAAGGPAGIDQRTDVYSLGATLYELLTLRSVVAGADRTALVRQILGAEPLPPRRLRPAVPRDLETIVLKALAKDPADRYPTARDLADDLERFLDDRPVAATRPGVWRRLRKWARRHRPVVATAAVAGVLLLVTAVVVLSVSMARVAREEKRKDEALQQAKANLEAAERQRARAERNSNRAFAAVDEMLARVALKEVSRFPEMQETRRELLHQALVFFQGLVQEHDPDPAARLETARAYTHMARVYYVLGQPTEADQAGRKAQAVFEQLAADFPADPLYRAGLASLHQSMGERLRVLDRPRQAEAHFDRSVGLYAQLAAENPDKYQPLLAGSNASLAYQQMLGGRRRFPDAERRFRDALAVQEPLEAAGRLSSVGLACAYNSLGLLLRLDGRPGEAEPLHRKALDRCERPTVLAPGGDLRMERARSHTHLAFALWGQDRREEAIRHAAAAVALHQDLARAVPLSADLGEMALAAGNLGAMLEQVNRRAEAGDAYRQAAVLAERLYAERGEQPSSERVVIGALTTLTRFLRRDSRAEAEQSFQRLRDLDPRSGESRNNLAWFLVTLPDPCLRDPRRAVELAEKAVAGAPQAGTFWNTLGVARYRSGDWERAIADLGQARQLTNNEGDSYNTFFLAMAHWQLGDHDQARRWYDLAVAWMDKNKPAGRELAELRRFRGEAKALLEAEPD